MSVQFGRIHFNGVQTDPNTQIKVDKVLNPYGPDSYHSYSHPGLSIIYGAFHTTNESRQEQQPHVTGTGSVLTWDGRLDNRREIVSEVGPAASIQDTDVALVGKAFDRWGVACLSKLIGDWALSIWRPHDKTLFLAKDFLGARHLYYHLQEDEIVWSTVLDALILGSNKSFHLDEEYIATWLADLPPTHLTPYSEIRAVAPSSCLIVHDAKVQVKEYWEFDGRKRVSYRTDREYEMHFRHLFSQSVVRRLRSQHPVLAELSGGIDSSSIVCVADDVIANGQSDADSLYTVSYYDDSEPNWDEKPYFTTVEQRRGQIGWHINVGPEGRVRRDTENRRFRATPAAAENMTVSDREFTACVISRQYRVLLSGIGGDEVLGGVPTPIPELADLLVKARFLGFSRQLRLWALRRRKPLILLLWDVLRRFLPQCMDLGFRRPSPPPWVRPEFLRRHRQVFYGGVKRTTVVGPLPSYQDYLVTLEGLRRGLACFPLGVTPLCERRYPYLDRDLLEFLYAIPRDQLVRPEQRRSLMRRALTGIVPEEVLNRKRKGYVVRGPIETLSEVSATLRTRTEPLTAEALGILDAAALTNALQQVRRGSEVNVPAMTRLLRLENWLSCLHQCSFIQPLRCSPLQTQSMSSNADSREMRRAAM
jgi:asparagine synthase (glutamine-hydrolysing)